MKNKEKPSRRIVNPRLVRGIVAIIAAILIWFYFNGSSTDLIEKDIANIPVTITGVDVLNGKGLYVADANVQYYVNLRLRGSEKNLKSINADSFTASIDLSDLSTSGSYTEDIVIQGLPNSVILEEMKPSAISFTIEEYSKRKEDVHLIVNGQPKTGYTVQSVTTDQKVTVTGLSSDLGKIDQVAATVSVMEMDATSHQTVQPKAYDSNGNAIDSVKIAPAEIEVVITIAKQTE